MAAVGSGSESEQEEEEVDALRGSDVHEVDQLRAKRRRGGRIEYLVKWKGWGSEHDSWEPTAHLPRCTTPAPLCVCCSAMPRPTCCAAGYVQPRHTAQDAL